MSPMLTMALRAAREAGRLLQRSIDRLDQVSHVAKGGNDADRVSEIDTAAEKIILEQLQQHYPDHGYLCEESGVINGKGSGVDYQWIIDPIDGTTNFIQGIPHCAISIALKVKNQLQLGVVYDPFKGEEFTAERGRGAFLNNRRIRVSNCHRLHQATIATGFPFHGSKEPYTDAYMSMFAELGKEVRAVRRLGSAALDLAYVAAGRYDGYFELDLKAWDIAAGCLLVKEAGGFVGDLSGGVKSPLDTGHVCAGNTKIFKSLVSMVPAKLHSLIK